LDPTRFSRSLLGAYPGDAVPPSEAASAHGVTELAQRYGYGDWNDKDLFEEGELNDRHGEDEDDDDDDGTGSLGQQSQGNDSAPPRRVRRMTKVKRRVRKKRTKVIIVERDDSFKRGFSIGFETGVDEGNEWSKRSRRRSRSPRPTSASRTTTQPSTTSDDSNVPSIPSSKTTLNNIFRSKRNNPGVIKRSHATSDSNGPSILSGSTMLHTVFTSIRNNASETKSAWDRPRDAPLAHSLTLSRRSNVDSTPLSPLRPPSTQEPRTMIRPALELLRQKRREQDESD
jgi:hypothetical protein